MERSAPTHIDAASVVSIATEPENAPTLLAGGSPAPPLPLLDPQQVITLINVNGLKHLLAMLGLQEQSVQVLDDLWNGFDIAARSPIPHTLIYKNHALVELVCAL